MVVYYPHLGSFRRSFKYKKEFTSLVDLCLYLYSMYQADTHYRYLGLDKRIGKPVFIVSVISYLGKVYDYPQCVGYFYFD